MRRIIAAIIMVLASLGFLTCERVDMHTLATLGLAPKTVIYIYPIENFNGDLGGRDSVDDYCNNQGLAYQAALKVSTVRGFISMSQLDELRFTLPVEFWYYPVVGVSPTMQLSVIANSWLGMLDGDIVTGIDTAVGIGGMVWWSGSNADGSFNADYNCQNWSSMDPAQLGQVGANGFASTTATCDSTAYLLCIAY
ncbi:MAG: hypothetical protein JXA07_09690 [Spirochaetes bacterium]|nr:hypothetical protein [Spirochaetota bacterium]